MTRPDEDPPRPSDLPAGYDETDPYADVDLSALPDWWRENVETFAEAGLRPYRPSRLADGALAESVVEELEAAFGTSIRFRSVDPHEGSEWEIWVGDEPVRTVEHVREPEGFTRYVIEADTLREVVADAVGDD